MSFHHFFVFYKALIRVRDNERQNSPYEYVQYLTVPNVGAVPRVLV